jgi:hypothetical protein
MLKQRATSQRGGIVLLQRRVTEAGARRTCLLEHCNGDDLYNSDLIYPPS